jgi:predicted HicB family RNase H-like nuclease
MARERTPKPTLADAPRKPAASSRAAPSSQPRGSDDLVAFGTRIPDQLAREVRAAAALEGRSVQDWVADVFRAALEQR